MDVAEHQEGNTQKNIKVEIVAGWFLALGVIGILLSVLLIISLIILAWIPILLPQTDTSGLLFLPLFFLLMVLSIIPLVYLIVIDFKIRTALRKREAEGYQSALIYLFFNAIIGLIMLFLSYLQSGHWQNLVLGTFVIAITLIFIYLLYSQRGAFINRSVKSLKLQTIIAMGLLGLMIAFQFLNPFQVWTDKSDENRFTDYSIISYTIKSYFTANGKLPATLTELINMQKLQYPVNKYQYKKISDTGYSICTIFATDTRSGRNPITAKLYYPTELNFQHNKGYDCFTYQMEDYMLPASQLIPATNPTNSSIFKDCMLIDDTSPNATLKLMGIYELDDSVVFTTNKFTNYATIEYWVTGPSPSTPTTAYLNAAKIFDTRHSRDTGQGVSLNKDMVYKLSIYDNLGNSATSQQYFFQGNRIVVQDSRCLPLEKQK